MLTLTLHCTQKMNLKWVIGLNLKLKKLYKTSGGKQNTKNT